MTAAPPPLIANPIDRALALMAPEVERFTQTLAQSLEPQRAYLSEAEYAIYGRGKKLRPLLLLMAARLNQSGDPSEPVPARVIKAAASLEMLHVATLIHDDIIETAPKRRGMASVNAARGSDMALLVGDMQFVQAVRCFTSAVEVPDDMVVVQTVLDVGFKICCGEIDELTTDPAWATARLRNRYFRTIDRKTAVLFELACETGATLMRSRKRCIWKMGRYGRLLGRAFQMMDDLNDFVSTEAEAGKAQGTDLRRRRPTLPIIYAMEELGPESGVSRIMRGQPATEDELRRVIDDVVQSAGFLRAYGEARAAIIEAVGCLEYFPGCALRDVFRDLAYYVVNQGIGARDELLETDGPERTHRAAS